MADDLRIRILGPFAIERGGQPLPDSIWRSRQERRLLAILLARRNRRTSSEQIAEWLWPGAEPSAALLTLRSAVSSLRRTLEPQSAHRASPRYILTQAGGYAWNTASGAWVDLEEFLALTEPPRDDPPDATSQQHLQRAVELYRGDLLEDEIDAPWLLSPRERLRDRYTLAVQALTALYLQRGDYAAAIAAAQRGLVFAPLCEPLWRQLMHAHLLAGDAAGALQSYERYRQTLDHELGALPSAQTQALHAAILRGEVPGAPPGADTPRALMRLADSRPPAALAPAAAPSPAISPSATVPLVGRRVELEKLHGQIAGLASGRGGTVAIVGEAGIGKSRLAFEALRSAAGVQPIVLRCSALERDLPFAPLGEPLRRLIRAAPDDVLQTLPASGLALVAELLPAVRDRLPHLPTVAPAPPAEHRNRLIDALADLALLLARSAPLVVLCDDAQWADEATLALLGRLAHRAPRHPALIILAYRSEEITENPALHALLRDLGREMLLQALVLERLDDAETTQLIAALGHVPAQQVARITPQLAAETGGNPLFLTVAVQSILEQYSAHSLGAIMPLLDAGAPLPDPRGARPIRDLVLGRLERLPPHARELAEQLAVIGRPASLDLIEQLAGTAGLEAAQVLLERQMLVEGADGRLGFGHELVRSIVADHPASPRRRLLHRRAAEALAALHGALGERAAEIASHYGRAGRGVDRELLLYAAAAGDHARSTRAYRAAVEHYNTALAAAGRLAHAARADAVRRAFAGRLLTYECLLDLEGVTATTELYARWASRRPEAPPLLVAPRRLVLLRALTGDLAGAAELSRSQADQAGQPSPIIADMLARTALILHPPSEDAPPAADVAPFVPAAPPPGDPAADLPALLGEEDAAPTLFQVGWALLTQGLQRDARPCLERAYELASATGQPAGAVVASLQMAHLSALVGDTGAVSRWLGLSLGVAQQAHEAAWLSIWPLIHQGFLWLIDDQHELALDRFDAMTRQLAGLHSFQSHRASVEVGRGLVALQQGRLDQAHQRLSSALSRPQMLYGFVYVAALHGVARIAALRGELTPARAMLGRALAYSGARQLLPEYARTAIEMARIERDYGDPERVLPLLRSASRLTQALGLTTLDAAIAALLRRLTT